MKKTLIMLAMMFATKSYSQVHTDSLLNTMTKMQLTNVYLDQVVQLAFSTPYTPFTIGVTDSVKNDLDIPVSKYIGKKREEILDMSTKYGETMKKQLYELIPYSDKKDMIHAILFLQEINGNIKNNVSK